MEQRKAVCVCFSLRHIFTCSVTQHVSASICFLLWGWFCCHVCLITELLAHNLLVYPSYTCCAQHGINIMFLNTENYRQFSTGRLLRVRCFIVIVHSGDT